MLNSSIRRLTAMNLRALEADGRADGDPQVVVRTVGEIHFVADFGSKPKYAGERLDAARGVKHAIEVSVRQDCGEIGESHGAGCNSEADESTLERSIEPPGPSFAEGKLWTQQKMRGPEVCANGIR